MQLKKLVAILFVAVGMMSMLGGCSMNNTVDNKTIRDEQDRMVLFLVNNYEGIEHVEFTSFEQNPSTQTWTSNAIVNGQVYVTFSIQRLSDDSEIGFGQHIKKSKNIRLKEKVNVTTLTDTDGIKVLHWEE